MRTAITLGFSSDGSAEIISGPEVDLNEQQRAFNDLVAGKSKYAEVQLWESNGGMRRTKRFGDKGTVNFNSAHPVENQGAKGKLKKGQSDLTPTSGGAGGVDFNSAHPVEKQQAKGKKKQKLPDLNAAQEEGVTGKKSGVNWDSVTPVEDQGKSGKARTRRGGAQKAAKSGKKSATKKAAAPKVAEKKARTAGQPDQAAKADDKAGSEGPTL